VAAWECKGGDGVLRRWWADFAKSPRFGIDDWADASGQAARRASRPTATCMRGHPTWLACAPATLSLSLFYSLRLALSFSLYFSIAPPRAGFTTTSECDSTCVRAGEPKRLCPPIPATPVTSSAKHRSHVFPLHLHLSLPRRRNRLGPHAPSLGTAVLRTAAALYLTRNIWKPYAPAIFSVVIGWQLGNAKAAMGS